MRTTRDHFRIFVDECEYWVEEFGLSDWFTYYTHVDKLPDTFANIVWDLESRSLYINMELDWDKEYLTEDFIHSAAFHEVCHGMLCRIHYFATSRFITEDEITEEIHVLISKLQKVCMERSHYEVCSNPGKRKKKQNE